MFEKLFESFSAKLEELEHGMLKEITDGIEGGDIDTLMVNGKKYRLTPVDEEPKELGLLPTPDFIYTGKRWTVTTQPDGDKWFVTAFIYQDHHELVLEKDGHSEVGGMVFATGKELPSWDDIKSMAFANMDRYEERIKDYEYTHPIDEEEVPEVADAFTVGVIRLEDGEYLTVTQQEYEDGTVSHEVGYLSAIAEGNTVKIGVYDDHSDEWLLVLDECTKGVWDGLSDVLRKRKVKWAADRLIDEAFHGNPEEETEKEGD